MASSISGDPTLQDQAIAVAVSRFNQSVTQQLYARAEARYLQQGGQSANLTCVWVPGAFELPATVKGLAESGRYAGVLALGAIIKGETYHFEVLSQQVTQALLDVSLQVPVPIAFGVLTTFSLKQALERAGEQTGDKGAEAMTSLIEMVTLTPKLP